MSDPEMERFIKIINDAQGQSPFKVSGFDNSGPKNSLRALLTNNPAYLRPGCMWVRIDGVSPLFYEFDEDRVEEDDFDLAKEALRNLLADIEHECGKSPMYEGVCDIGRGDISRVRFKYFPDADEADRTDEFDPHFDLAELDDDL